MQETLHSAIRTALGYPEGYILGWRSGLCQVQNLRADEILPCPYRESRWQCEVIGPHTQHRWSDHLMVHERMGNGWPCSMVGDRTLADLYEERRPTPFHVVSLS